MGTSTEHHVINGVVKTRNGKGAARELRRNGMIPAVVYGLGQTPEHVGINLKDVGRAFRVGHFYTHTQELNIDGKSIKVLAKSVQRDPVTDQAIHIDFLRYNPSSTVHVNVMVKLVGEEQSPGIKEGGVLQLIETSLAIVCRADSIPEEIVVDISKLGVSESVHLSDIKLPEGTRSAVTDRDLTIASVISTRTSTMAALDAEADAEQAASAEVPASEQKDDAAKSE